MNINIRTLAIPGVPVVLKQPATIPTAPGKETNISDDALLKYKIETPAETSLELTTNEHGTRVFLFKDKETGEVVREMPSKVSQANSERIDKFIERLAMDLLKP